jgi:hypothetical protein
MNCKNRIENRCTLGLHGGSPSLGVCLICYQYDGPPRGAGDVIHAITTATGIAKAVDTVTGGCGGCARRRAALNAAVPFTDEESKG